MILYLYLRGRRRSRGPVCGSPIIVKDLAGCFPSCCCLLGDWTLLSLYTCRSCTDISCGSPTMLNGRPGGRLTRDVVFFGGRGVVLSTTLQSRPFGGLAIKQDSVGEVGINGVDGDFETVRDLGNRVDLARSASRTSITRFFNDALSANRVSF